MKQSASSSPTSPNQLLALGVIGLALLWGGMVFNGTLDTFTQVQKTGVFPNGRPLQLEYTGWKALDSGLSGLVAFFDVLTNKDAGASKWLLFETSVLVRTLNAWVLTESRRRGVRQPLLRHAIGLWLLENFFGAGWVAPLYLYCITQSKYTTRDRTIPLNETRAFAATYLVQTFTSLYCLFAPSYFNWSTADQQRYLNYFQLNPMLICFAVVLFSRPGTTPSIPETPKDEKNPNVDAGWVITAFNIMGVVSSAAHIFTVLSILTGFAGPSTTFSAVFRPSPGSVTSAIPGSYEALKAGIHLFTQYDLILTGTAALVFVHYMLSSIPRKNGVMSWDGPLKANKELLAMAAGSVVLGPAGVGSFALAVRENRLRAEIEVKSN